MPIGWTISKVLATSLYNADRRREFIRVLLMWYFSLQMHMFFPLCREIRL